MDQKDWTKAMRDRLADYKADVPDGLWTDIDNALDGKRRRMLVMRRWAVSAAAVVVAFVIAGSAYYLSKGSDQTTFIARHIPAAIPPSAAEGSLPNVKSADAPLLVALTADEKQRLPMTSDVDAASHVATTYTMEQPSNAISSDNHESRTTVTSSSTDRTDKQTATPALEPIVRNNGDVMRNNASKLSHHRSGKISLGAYSSNIMSGNTGMQSIGGNGVMSDFAMTNNMLKSRPLGMGDYSEKKKHYMPLSFGLSVGYGLNDRVMLNTGLVYTRTVTDITRTSVVDSHNERRTLHYVGIPFGVGYRLWSTGALKVYATAGGQVDFNVTATSREEDNESHLDKDRLQWSVGAAAGVEYDFVPNLGVYVEPGAKYYIKNGSGVDNIFKDKPFNFSLQIGLRYNMK